jgi:hypothetical protein
MKKELPASVVAVDKPVDNFFRNTFFLDLTE